MPLTPFATSFAAIAVVSVAGSAQGALLAAYLLEDHPDGLLNPPPYGLRSDNIFAAAPYNQPGEASFSMNVPGNVKLKVWEDAPAVYRITITGKVYGGLDVGATYGFGEGLYKVDFEYAANVTPSGTGWIVTSESALNDGTLTSLGNPDVPLGDTFALADEFGNPPGFTFGFLQDEHRLAGYPQAGQGYFVGRGWFDGHGVAGTRDWLFLGKVPAPGAGAVMLAGLGFAGARRRRG